MLIETRDVEGGVRILSLNRPPANAIDGELMEALSSACAAAVADDSVRAVVLTGTGKFFCGGLDLERITATPAGMAVGVGFGNRDGVFALWTLSKPTVAMINGHAIAGGGILALACDVRIAAAGNLKMGLNEVAIGLAFPIGAFEITRLALTDRQARRVMLDAQIYSVDRAREYGMVDDIVDPGRLEAVCRERARLLGGYAAAAYAHTKRTLQSEAVERVLRESPEYRRDLEQIWRSPETLRVLQAQLAGLRKK